MITLFRKTAWCEINYKDPQNKNKVYEQIIWWNLNLKIKGTPLAWPHFVQKGIWKVKDLFQNTYTELDLNWLEWQSLLTAFPPVWKMWLKDEHMPEQDVADPLFDTLSQFPKVTCSVYDMLIDDELRLNKYVARWVNTGCVIDPIKLRMAFVKYDKCIKTVKYLDFQ